MPTQTSIRNLASHKPAFPQLSTCALLMLGFVGACSGADRVGGEPDAGRVAVTDAAPEADAEQGSDASVELGLCSGAELDWEVLGGIVGADAAKEDWQIFSADIAFLSEDQPVIAWSERLSAPNSLLSRVRSARWNGTDWQEELSEFGTQGWSVPDVLLADDGQASYDPGSFAVFGEAVARSWTHYFPEIDTFLTRVLFRETAQAEWQELPMPFSGADTLRSSLVFDATGTLHSSAIFGFNAIRISLWNGVAWQAVSAPSDSSGLKNPQLVEVGNTLFLGSSTATFGADQGVHLHQRVGDSWNEELSNYATGPGERMELTDMIGGDGNELFFTYRQNELPVQMAGPYHTHVARVNDGAAVEIGTTELPIAAIEGVKLATTECGYLFAAVPSQDGMQVFRIRLDDGEKTPIE